MIGCVVFQLSITAVAKLFTMLLRRFVSEDSLKSKRSEVVEPQIRRTRPYARLAAHMGARAVSSPSPPSFVSTYTMLPLFGSIDILPASFAISSYLMFKGA